MASYVFSANPNVAFDPNPGKDVLQIDTTSAAKVRVNQVGSNVVLTDGTNTATLQNVLLGQLSTGTVSFSDGSVLLIGDDNVALNDGGANKLTGGAGNDRLFGLGGADTLNGGAAADVIYGNQGNDLIYTTSATGADTVYGGQNADVVDYLASGGGPAATYDAANAATATSAVLVYGNLGDDVLITGRGGDKIYGGQGNDAITTGGGNDLVYGNLGNDTVNVTDFQTTDRVSVYGGQGDDVVGFTGAANNGQALIYGNLGNDILAGGTGNDAIYGGQGVDSITGGAGADVLTGGLGNDTFRYNGAADSGVTTASADTIRDFVSGSDKVGFGGAAGTNANYREFASTTVTSVETALTAYAAAGNPQSTYTFIAGANSGYLIYDPNTGAAGNESIVQVAGGTDLSKFDFTDIIA